MCAKSRGTVLPAGPVARSETVRYRKTAADHPEDPLAHLAAEAMFRTGTPETMRRESAEGGWERPKKEPPAFQLADLSGKSWKFKQPERKALLINLWATWCGSCQAELPKRQKLYDSLKARTDVQVLTFNIDDAHSRCCGPTIW